MKRTVAGILALIAAKSAPGWSMFETGGVTGIDLSGRRVTLDARVTYPVAENIDISSLQLDQRIRFDLEKKRGQ